MRNCAHCISMVHTSIRCESCTALTVFECPSAFFFGLFVFVLNLLFSGLICTYTVFNSHEVLDEFWYLPNYLPKQLINLWMKGGQRHYLFVFTVVSMLFLQLKYFIQITWVVVGFHRLSINALINAIFYLGLLPTY